MLQVLILDDDPMFCRTLQRSLRHNPVLPCEATVATSREEAYAAVQAAEEPFDAFLIDEQLGPGGPDGIDVLRSLLELSPQSGAVLFTLGGDVGAGMRAYQAGAYRYLHKPIETTELIVTLRSLSEWRVTKRERDELKVLNEIARAAQRLLSVEEMGQVIVDSGQRLGFERARLWLLGPDGRTLYGLTQKGNLGLDTFRQVPLPIDESRYVQRALASREPVVFHGSEHGDSYLYRTFRQQGFRLADGDWAALPLWAADHCLGLLLLDNFTQPGTISAAKRELLTLFGQQVAAALERAQLSEQEQQRLEALATIGRSISNRAANVKLNELLAEVYEELRKLITADNFQLVLKDGQNGALDLRLTVVGGSRQPRQLLRRRTPLAYVIEQRQPLLLSSVAEIDRFYREQRLTPNVQSAPALSWLSVPLHVDERVIGAIAVWDTARERRYGDNDRRLLAAVAGQVAGAIQAAWLREEAEQRSVRLEILHQAGEELMRLAQRNEEWFWWAVLTALTASYALRFNRAMLFLAESGDRLLSGRMGLGHFEEAAAQGDWERDDADGLTFELFLEQLKHNGLQRTPLDEAVRALRQIHREGSVFDEVLSSGRSALVRADELARRFPPGFVERFGATDYLVAPLQVAGRSLGLIVLDNTHNQIPLEQMPLKELDTLLSQVALIHDNVRQQRANEKLLDLNLTVLAQAAHQPLKQLLDEICEMAQQITGADNVLIYPLLVGATDDLRYDKPNISSVGLRNARPIRGRLHSDGVSRRVLQRKGPTTVRDVSAEAWLASARQDPDAFLNREQIQAFIAAPITDAGDGALVGVLYLNYRSRQSFAQRERKQALAFAELAGAAIRAARENASVRQGRAEREGELRILQHVLETALRPTADLEELKRQVYTELLRAIYRLIQLDGIRAGLILRDWQAPRHSYEEPHEVWRQFFLIDDQLLQAKARDIRTGIPAEALRRDDDLNVPDVTTPEWQGRHERIQIEDPIRSELDVLIRLDQQILGIINVESPRVAAFSEEHHQMIKRVERIAALALSNISRQKNLRNLLELVNAVISPSDLPSTLATVIDAARSVAPGVSAVTIWYKDPVREAIVPGPAFGVRRESRLVDNPLKQTETVLYQVLHAEAPIWAPHVADEPRLQGAFVDEEKICSVAAFPLRMGGAQGEAIGALFFNYRQPHAEFTLEEQALFQILANAAAISVHDALRVKELQTSETHLRTALEITQAVGAALDIDTTLRSVMTTLKRQLPVDRLCVMIYNGHNHTLELAPASREFYPALNHPATVRSLTVDRDVSIAARVACEALTQRRAICENTPNVRMAPGYLETSPTTNSQFSLALLNSRQELLGVLVLESDRLAAFTPEMVALLEGVGPSIGSMIERAYVNTELRRTSIIAAQTAWAADIAHDINKEIAVIRNSAYLLRGTIPADHHADLAAIDASAERLNSYARASRSSAKTRLALDRWIEEKTSTIVAHRGTVGCRFELRCAGVDVFVSEIMLERVLRHLLRNAFEAMDKPDILTVRTRLRAGMAEVQIHNPGLPIDDLTRAKLFVERVSTKEKGRDGVEGGLGLLFVYAALEAMGGKIELLPPGAGDGVTFAFTLPVAS